MGLALWLILCTYWAGWHKVSDQNKCRWLGGLIRWEAVQWGCSGLTVGMCQDMRLEREAGYGKTPRTRRQTLRYSCFFIQPTARVLITLKALGHRCMLLGFAFSKWASQKECAKNWKLGKSFISSSSLNEQLFWAKNGALRN